MIKQPDEYEEKLKELIDKLNPIKAELKKTKKKFKHWDLTITITPKLMDCSITMKCKYKRLGKCKIINHLFKEDSTCVLLEKTTDRASNVSVEESREAYKKLRKL